MSSSAARCRVVTGHTKRSCITSGPRRSSVNVLKQPIERRRGPQTLTTTQIEQVLETCKTPRDRLIVHMLFETGLRPGELLALWLEDVRISPPQVQVVDRGELVNHAEIKRPASERAIDVSRDLINRVLD